MMDPEKKEKQECRKELYHHSKFVKQLCYYAIMVVLQLRLIKKRLTLNIDILSVLV